MNGPTDGSDESNCANSHGTLFLCSDGKTFIDISLQCNGRHDCPDGSDEQQCTSGKCNFYLFFLYFLNACECFSNCPEFRLHSILVLKPRIIVFNVLF